MIDRNETRQQLASLAADPKTAAVRIATCNAIARALQGLGHTLWHAGYFIGRDRVDGISPFGFGSDATVGLATVTQIGGELARGAIALLTTGNRYAGAALIRQIVEVEYLASAFAEGDGSAMEWLHADRDARRQFWSPAAMRKRAGGRFLASDYWGHCDRGGHPTREGRMLLPDHEPSMDAPMLWVELANHLAHVWTDVTRATRQHAHYVDDTWINVSVDEAIAQWTATDTLAAALRDVSAAIREPTSQSCEGSSGPT